jgi:Rrf2 family protein
MQVTHAVDYGVRALMFMARHPVGTRHYLQNVAEQARLPRNYLVKVLKGLTGQGIVRPHRGINGGFSLARDPREISLRQVIEAIDGPVTVVHCLTDPRRNGACPNSGRCAAQVLLSRVRHDLLTALASYTLADLVAIQKELEAPP